jgi:integrase
MKSPSLPSEIGDANARACNPASQEIVAVGESNSQMRQREARVHGPYPHHQRWRLFFDDSKGRHILTFESEAEAKRRKQELLKEIAGRTVSDAIRAHLASLRERGLRDSTTSRAETHLRRFFELDEKVDGQVVAYAKTGGFLEDLRLKHCEALYGKLCKQVAVDTHRNSLVAVKTFGKWCVKQGWLHANPAADVTPFGQRNRGKKQLRIDEARKLVELCITKANAGNDAAVGVLTALLMGMRASEVTDRVVRDLDDQGRLLWIEVGKTKRSRRTLEVPALLRPYLLALAKDRAPEEQLITRGLTKRRRKRDRQWLRHWLQDFCDEANIPRVCVHSLRGLHATLATEAGVSSHAVANALGHTSAAVTYAHYVQPGTQKRMSTRRVVQKLGDPNPVRRIPETIRGRSVSGAAKRLSPLL